MEQVIQYKALIYCDLCVTFFNLLYQFLQLVNCDLLFFYQSRDRTEIRIVEIAADDAFESPSGVVLAGDDRVVLVGIAIGLVAYVAVCLKIAYHCGKSVEMRMTYFVTLDYAVRG